MLHTPHGLIDLSHPIVMGILNVTPDSFYDGGRHVVSDDALAQADKMLTDGATILDIGGASSRPGAATVSVDEELRRVLPVIEGIRARFPACIISIDTWRSEVAHEAVMAGADIVNDISAGQMDEQLWPTVAALQTPYILMHMQGRPENMQQAPHYSNVMTEVLDFFIESVASLRRLGVKDIVLDPGFGFGKTLEHNYTLLRDMRDFQTVTGLPLLAGISRKSMIYKLLNISAADALPATAALHMVALQSGASILRAHDVAEAVQVIRLWEMLQNPSQSL